MVTVSVNCEQPALLHARTFQVVKSYALKNDLLGAISNDWRPESRLPTKLSVIRQELSAERCAFWSHH